MFLLHFELSIQRVVRIGRNGQRHAAETSRLVPARRGQRRRGAARGLRVVSPSGLLAQTREISDWRPEANLTSKQQAEMPRPEIECRKDNGRPADRVAR